MKVPTPEYILDIRAGKYSKSGAAKKILEECGQSEFPINVWQIARELDFKVLEAKFQNNNISGMLIDALEVPQILKKFDCKRAIILNQNEQKNVQSFTIAHELAHFVYDCNENENCFDAYHISREKEEDHLNIEEKKKKENEDRMDEFAAMLLMPEIQFREFINSSPNRWNKRMLEKEVSKVCMVEETAVNKRFEELGISFDK